VVSSQTIYFSPPERDTALIFFGTGPPLFSNPCSWLRSFSRRINDASSSLTYFLLGEIDIMEARGNGPSYPNQYVILSTIPFQSSHRLFPANCIITDLFNTNRGSNYVRGSLNWGPLSWLNAVYKTFGWWSLRRGSYDQDFHSYVLEWDQDFMYVSLLPGCVVLIFFFIKDEYTSTRAFITC
jgi:hypothetical protein